MAVRATAVLSSIFAGGIVSSFVSASTCRRNFFIPINLAWALASRQSRFRNIHKHHSFNAVHRNLSCEATATVDVSASSSVPTTSNRFVADLIHFGAVFYALVCPDPPPTATPEQIKLFKEFTDPLLLRKRSSIKGKTIREAQKTFRISCSDEFVEPGTYLLVHVHPKRFPRCYEIDWRSRIIAVAESYVVLDKPAGTSVGGTTDNIEESCATFATRALGLEAPLRTTHQIDNCTEGCVVFARTKEYCSVFHRTIREKKVKKLYLALAAAPVPIGVITHYMRPVNIAPWLICGDIINGWHICQLEVLECRKVPCPQPKERREL